MSKSNPMDAAIPAYEPTDGYWQAGRVAFENGDARDSTHWHDTPREGRSASEDQALAAFELGWDTAKRAAEK